MHADRRSVPILALVLGLALALPACAQERPPTPKPATEPAAAPAPAATPARQAKPRQPIEIVADRLQVNQEQQLAVFSGNVNAVQGDMNLRADQLRVFYTDTDDEPAGGAAAGGAGGDAQSIRRIEAQGNVMLSQPGETAEGDQGVYDPVANKLVLEGDVVLTRGQNVVRGNRLDSDLASGVSVVSAAPGGQRVRALFVQGQEEGSR